MLQDCLSEAGFTVSEAGNGIDALELLRANNVRPRLILLDLAMPLMGGVEFLEVWRGMPCADTVPIVVLTAAQRESDHLTANGVAQVLVKPFEIDTLLEIVTRYVPFANDEAD